jgi:hypothetical protein
LSKFNKQISLIGKNQMLTNAEKNALTEAIQNLKVDQTHGGTLRTLLALDPAATDAVGPVRAYIIDPENPGAAEIPRSSLSIEDMRTMLVASDMVINSKDADVKAVYNQVVSNLSGLVTVKLVDEGWAAFLAFLTEHNLLSADRMAAFTTIRVSLAENAIGRIPAMDEVSAVLFNDTGERLI